MGDEEPDEYTHFMKWVQEQGVTINGIRSIAQPGRGRGIFTTQPVKKGQLLVNVPANCLLTVPSSAKRQETVQGRLAGRLLADSRERIKPWMSVMPSLQDMRACMPLMWPREVQDTLPEGARNVLEKQQQKFESDWMLFNDSSRDFSAAKLGITMSGDVLREQYIYCWLLVNTRCFYWDFAAQGTAASKAKRGHGASKKKLPDSECMALCPFMDFFNHDNHGIQASYNKAGYFVMADRDYDAGEEILFSYGSYTNDFLLVEYGFFLDSSDSDGVTIDSVILALLDANQTQELKDSGLLGNYVLSSPTLLCHRTQCALRAALLPSRQLNRFIRGESDGEKEQPAVDQVAKRGLQEYADEVIAAQVTQLTLMSQQGIMGASSCLGRWHQIENILTQSLKEL